MISDSRRAYLAHEITFDEYYARLAARIAPPATLSSPDFLARVREALASGDRPLNTIPLREWDAMAYGYEHSAHVHRVFKAHGDLASLAGLVCLFKHIARTNAKEPQA